MGVNLWYNWKEKKGTRILQVALIYDIFFYLWLRRTNSFELREVSLLNFEDEFLTDSQIYDRSS